MSGRRTYGDACGIARGLDVIGERWAILVVRELLLGPKRFTDLRAGLPRLGADILSQRLRELEEAGVVRRDQLPPTRRLARLPVDRLGPRARARRARPRSLGQPRSVPERP